VAKINLVTGGLKKDKKKPASIKGLLTNTPKPKASDKTLN